jgi:thiamine pyrophosphokinase
MRVLVISGGKAPKEATIRNLITEDTYIICADSGGNVLYEYKIFPDLLLGDFDSIDGNVLKYYEDAGCTIDRYKCEKNFTDTEAAVEEAMKLNPEEIFLLGSTGTRIDHTLANLGLLYRCYLKNIASYLVDENNEVSIYGSNFTFKEVKGQTFSVQAFGGMVKNLSIKGAKYELINYDLYFGDPRTISNKCTDYPVNINFDSGILILIKSND